MGAPQAGLLLDAAAWAGNVSSSVLIIFINKALMQASGYGFKYATTLSALHYIVCSASIWATMTFTKAARHSGKLPFFDLVLFVAVANLSIVSLNISLMINPVGFYQIAKLMIIPFICAVERLWLGRVFTLRVILSVLVVVVGVGIVTVSDLALEHNVAGVAVAGLSIVTSGMQQGYSLILIGPFLDYYVSHAWVFQYTWSRPAAVMLALSCAAAVGVNLSQFACLGRFSAASFQILGHSKTILVLLGGWAFLGDVVTLRQFAGMAIAVAGMIAYGAATSQPPAAQPAGKAGDEEAGAPKGAVKPKADLAADIVAKSARSRGADDGGEHEELIAAAWKK